MNTTEKKSYYNNTYKLNATAWTRSRLNVTPYWTEEPELALNVTATWTGMRFIIVIHNVGLKLVCMYKAMLT